MYFVLVMIDYIICLFTGISFYPINLLHLLFANNVCSRKIPTGVLAEFTIG